MAKFPKVSITTIKISKKTKERLDHLNEHKETYDAVINKVLNIINICLKNPLLANKILRDMEKSRKLGNLIDNPEKILKRKNNIERKPTLETSIINNMQRNMQSLRPQNNPAPQALSRLQQKPENKIPQKIPPKFQPVRREE